MINAQFQLTQTNIDAALEAGTPTLHEVLGQQYAMDHAIKPIYAGASIVGRALTVKLEPSDNLDLHRAIYEAQQGDVIVANANGYLESGIWGEVTSVASQVRGIAGLVVDGAVRDTREIARMGFPVFSRGVSIKGSGKNGGGNIGMPIVCGGVQVQTGDIVVADADGVVCIPPEVFEQALEKSRARLDKESEVMAQLKQGKRTLDLLGFV
ncbi:4-carboxy-4-hydroxy-2-oxoadipate aldolase/oxaloacetate decarboxylase [Halomonas sp. ANAO-440]|uniref:4-carboxy-4-hydroxy-2-oxoadipate aldolase/oxaloacetate decarboxylase n=1 Tax=Halomonas sp. ANAO-440 TaxID=2861360 RepID=UPI001CAA6EE0|nr:4-carboxy-4-hydroxy-2-oxoadipate aldolase/oxaloacetate decarboxylase [Halomonas sp. ANAO-440]MBZ0331004.1 4-carboxy-4-hydroxy-2-oxoadipate aldolase/oxaloacetate decarboxylase [Halomonas sp. ANAO-440]